MSDKTKKLQREYRSKLADLDAAIEEERRQRSIARKAGDPEIELAVRSADIEGLNRVRQTYVQFLRDLDDL